MSATATATVRGRVLVLGPSEAAAGLVERLSRRGYSVRAAARAANVLEVARGLRPEVVFVAPGEGAQDALAVVRGAEALRELPVLAEVGGHPLDVVRALGVDDWVHGDEELAVRLEAALRARRLMERDQVARARMETLLEVAQVATSTLELDQILGIAVDKISRVIAADRCSVVLVEPGSPRAARVVASGDLPQGAPLSLDLARYPELRRALETRQTVKVDDAARDPLMDEVRRIILPLGIRSILVQPLICQEDVLGALFLRLSRTEGAFGREELEFAQAVAAALAGSVRNARLHQALKRKRDDLESAYVDRYRELTEANKRLKELNRFKDEMIAVCSHDLRSPLNVLLGHGRLLQETALAAQERSSVDAMVRQGKKILDLVESLLEQGKGDQARFALEPRTLDLAELCKEITQEMEILSAERGVALRAETPECLQVLGDEVKLSEVLENLIGNAIQHAPQNGLVVVHAQRVRRPDGDIARVVVEDNGPGIPPAELHLVFDRYRHGPGGTGLGLAICREFVELHGGEIWAENVPDGGAAFMLTLPLAREIERPAEPAASGDQTAPRVLVVEDEPEVAAVVAEILRSRYRVEVARDGAEGLAKARSLLPDLVVMDVFLPRLDGLDAAAALKGAVDTADIPVILLSAHQGVADKLRALNLGAVDYLAKPFQALELLACAERALKLRQTERELARSQSLLRLVGSDPETGLLDRAGFTVRLDQELSRARRYRRPLCVAVLRPRAPVGEGLRAAAAALRQTLRAPDVLGHLGEGVFLLALPECDLPEAEASLMRILPVLEEGGNVRFDARITPAADGAAEALVDAALSRGA
jgi:two-component system sensor histidine kinase ChiS